MLRVETRGEELSITFGNIVLKHSPNKPLLFYGYGEANYSMSHGNFKIEDELFFKIPAKRFSIEDSKIVFDDSVEMKLIVQKDLLVVRLHPLRKLNRLWFRLDARKDEHVYGCGEQYSHFDLRGKKVPIFVSEQGVGRNRKDFLTLIADFVYDAGGDWYSTYFPQPLFVSSRKYFCFVDGSSYMMFDFSKEDFFELMVWQLPVDLYFSSQETWEELLNKLTETLGRQTTPPEWIYDGIVLGIQGGTDIVLKKLEKVRSKGLKVAGIWIQDWEGRRVTTFGKQLFWNWSYSEELYRDLPKTIEKLKGEGIRVLGYINPFLALEGELYREASKKGYLVRKNDGTEYHVVITTFPAAIVDLTNPEAFEWLKGVIKKNMIDIGLSGWMADYGEYLPADAKLFSGEPAEIFHNKFPVEWARLNYEAVKESGKLGEIVFFMRSGYLKSARHTPMYWHGDQLVNWSKDDGLPSVIPAKLSLAMSGVAFVHSDIGGYTTLAKNLPERLTGFRTVRTKELFMRWAELSAFEPMMRTHEGNWPEENWQFDSDEETIDHLIRMVNLHVQLKPYFLSCQKEYFERGLPLFRPIMLYYDGDEFKTEQYEFLLGRDILVAPVLEEKATVRKVILPNDEWVHYWSGKVYRGGEHEIVAPLGEPPFFIRKEARVF
ncbi:alpha-glucosidase [Pseudothermotoga sp.]|nr:alpha-glucosidase [Pseudothermotoga sp.]MCX7813436.1 alpha-glucosidase [Pseudothermotoga sp.]MDW8139576.1 alpha-glucosidase [Pseudothermotoga sp.]